MKIIERGPDFDLIILDIMMPKISGLEVARSLRLKYSLFELPILMLTGRNQVADMLDGFESGANDYLIKPFDGNELIARVKTLIKLKKLTKANSVLQEAIELKNQFINMTIHDLKNPLNVIQGSASIMNASIEKENEDAELLGLILESSTLMLNLIQELLEAAKIESGKLALKRDLIDLNEIVTDVVDRNLMRALQKNQTINFSPDLEDKYNVYADKTRIHEVVDNLVNNAIKYSPSNRNIWIKLIPPNETLKKKYVRIEVIDEGPGLSPEDKKKLFGKFQRLSAQPTDGESSSGLGLSIVKQLVELHDGSIWAESELGKGTTFIVELPANADLVAVKN